MLGFQTCCLEHTSIQSVPNLNETLKNTFHCSHGPESHFSTNSGVSFWVLKLKSMSAVTVLCQLLCPSHVESGGCCGPAYMAGRVGLIAPGATEVDWAPRWKSQPWVDKGFHMSSRVSLSRVPAWFLLCRKAFQSTDVMAKLKEHLRLSQCSQFWAKINKTCAWAWLLGDDNFFLNCGHVLHGAI